MSKPLQGKIALVTGASRGAGKGCALQLAQAGALVYMTARTLTSVEGVIGSLEQTAKEIEERNGQCVPIQCDHEDQAQVAAVFERISKEQNGRLDILVNCAFKAMRYVIEEKAIPFWEIKPERFDDYMNAGLRNHYFCTVYATRLMIPRKQGLIVYISSIAGSRYLFNPLYGISKAGVDRMAMDCGIELRDHNIAVVSLEFGGIRTEYLTENVLNKAQDDEYFYTDPIGIRINGEFLRELFKNDSSQEFPGKVVAGLASDPKVIKYSGKTLIAPDYARSHHIRDVDNRTIPSFRQINYGLLFLLPKQLRFVRDVIPDFVKLPKFVFDIVNTKF